MIMIEYGALIAYPCIVIGIALAIILGRDEISSSRSQAILRSEILLIIGITLGALCLRVWGIKFGLPYNFHPDEIPKLNAITRMREAGDLNPRYFLHPSLLLYSTHFLHRFGEMLGIWDASRESLNLAGRSVSLIAGTLTIPVLWFFVRTVTQGKARVALLSAALLAVFPLHITCSRYLKEDALVTFWMVVTAAIVASVVTNPKASWRLLWAGFFAGVAASSKYTGLIFFAFVLAAPWLRSRDWKPDRKLLLLVFAAGAMMLVGFLLCTPYALLDWPTFINDFTYEQRHMSKGHMVVITPWAHYWSYHVGRSLIPGVGLFDAVLAIIGVGAAIVCMLRDRSRVAALCLLGLAITYLPAEWVKAKPEPQPDRYLMVCMPWCAVLVALMIDKLSFSGRRVLLAGTLTLFAIAFPLTRSVQLAREIGDDTRLQLAHWIEANIPNGSKIAVDYEWYGPPLDPAHYTVTSLHGSEILERVRVNELRKADYDYVIITSFFRDRFFRQADNLGAFRDLFRNIDRTLPIVKSFEFSTGPYGFHNPRLTMYRIK